MNEGGMSRRVGRWTDTLGLENRFVSYPIQTPRSRHFDDETLHVGEHRELTDQATNNKQQPKHQEIKEIKEPGKEQSTTPSIFSFGKKTI